MPSFGCSGCVQTVIGCDDVFVYGERSREEIVGLRHNDAVRTDGREVG